MEGTVYPSLRDALVIDASYFFVSQQKIRKYTMKLQKTSTRMLYEVVCNAMILSSMTAWVATQIMAWMTGESREQKIMKARRTRRAKRVRQFATGVILLMVKRVTSRTK